MLPSCPRLTTGSAYAQRRHQTQKMGVVEIMSVELRRYLYNPSPRSVLLVSTLPHITFAHNGTKVGIPLSGFC
jgi:hypothetical protein